MGIRLSEFTKPEEAGIRLSQFTRPIFEPTIPDTFGITPEPLSTFAGYPMQRGGRPEQIPTAIGAAPKGAEFAEPTREMTAEERAATALTAEKYLASGKLEEDIAVAKATDTGWDKFQTGFTVGLAKGMSGGYLDPGEYLERTGDPNAMGIGYLTGIAMPFKGIHAGLRAIPAIGKGMGALSRAIPAMGVPAETGAVFGVHGGLRKPEAGERRISNIAKEAALGVLMGMPFGGLGQIMKAPAKIPLMPEKVEAPRPAGIKSEIIPKERIPTPPEGGVPILDELLGVEKPKAPKVPIIPEAPTPTKQFQRIEIPAEVDKWIGNKGSRSRAAIYEYTRTGNRDMAVREYRDAESGLYGGDRRSKMASDAAIDEFLDRISKVEKPVAKPKAPPTRAVAETEVAKVKDVSIDQIKTDVDKFQNRFAEFSEETAKAIAERYDPNKFDPIVLWKDAKTGENYVVSGHSRLEGLKRRGESRIPARYFEGTEAQAKNFATIEANRLQAKETLAESVRAYTKAKKAGYAKAKMKDLFGVDLNTLEAIQHLDQKGKFIEVLSQPNIITEFPFIKRFATWVGQLRGEYGVKLKGRHEGQLFDFLYKEGRKNIDIAKDDFFNLVEKNIKRADWSVNQPLVLKRAEIPAVGTRAREDTGWIENKIDDLKALKEEARTVEERTVLDQEISKLSAGIQDIVKSQADIFAMGEAGFARVPKKEIPAVQKTAITDLFGGEKVVGTGVKQENFLNSLDKKAIETQIRKRLATPEEVKRVQAEGEAPEVLPGQEAFWARPEEIPYDRAYDARRWSSMVPEERAVQIQKDYANTLNSYYEELKPLAKSPEQQAVLDSEFARFKSGYRQKYLAMLDAESRTASTMVTGGSNFPTARNAKRLATADKRSSEVMEFRDRAIKSIKRKLKEQAVEDAGGPVKAMEKKVADAERLQDTMRKANAIIRKKNLTDAEKVSQIVKDTGLKESTAQELLKPDFMGRKGFAQYQLTNNLANIKRMKGRVSELAVSEGKSGVEPVKQYEGAEVVNNFDAERVQITFDKIPDETLRGALKGEGWRWSPANKVWQRKNTPQAVSSAERILEKHLPKPSERGAVPISGESGFIGMLMGEKFPKRPALYKPGEFEVGKIEVPEIMADLGITSKIQTPAHLLGAYPGAKPKYGKAVAQAQRKLLFTERDMKVEVGRRSDEIRAIRKSIPREDFGKTGDQFIEIFNGKPIDDILARTDIKPKTKEAAKKLRDYFERDRQEIISRRREQISPMATKAAEAEYRMEHGLYGKRVRGAKDKAFEAKHIEGIRQATEEKIKGLVPDDWGIRDYFPQIHPGDYRIEYRGKYITSAGNKGQVQEAILDHGADLRKTGIKPDAADYNVTRRDFHDPDVVRISGGRYWKILNDLGKASEVSQKDIAGVLRGKIGRREAKQKWGFFLQKRKGALGYSQDFKRVMEIYNRSYTRWKHLTDLNKEFQPLLQQIRAEGRTGVAEYLEANFRQLWGQKTELSKLFDASMQKIPGVKNHIRPFALDRWLGMVKSGFTTMVLKLNPRFHMLNRAQTWQTLAPLVDRKTWIEGHQLYHSPEGRALLDKYGVRYLTGGKIAEGQRAKTRPATREKMRGFAPETYNQEMAWTTMYSKARKMGLPEAEAADYGFLAGNVRSQFAYLRSDMPAAFRGPVPSTIFMYKRFPIKAIELGSDLLRSKHYSGFARFIGTQLLLGGAKLATGLVPKVTGIGYISWNVYNKIKDEYGETAANAIAFGLPGFLGMDWSYSVQFLDLPYGEGIAEKIGNVALGPPGQVGVRVGRAVFDTKGPEDRSAFERAMRRLTQSFPATRWIESLEMVLEGDYNFKDPAGRVKFKGDLLDVLKNALGARSAKAGVDDMFIEALMQVKEPRDERIDAIVAKVLNSKFDEANQLIAQWNELWSDFPILSNDIETRAMRRYQDKDLTRVERFLKQSGKVFQASEQFQVPREKPKEDILSRLGL